MKLKRLTALILVFLMLMGVSVQANDPLKPLYFEYVNELADYIMNDYYFGVDRKTLMDAALKESLTNPEGGIDAVIHAMFASLDENSSFIPAESLDDFMGQSVTGTFVGIGVMILGTNGRIVVTEPLEGSPAQAAGILPNDIIVSVDGVSLDGKTVTEARELILGEEGTQLVLGVLRGDNLLEITVTRGEIQDETVTYEVIDGVGYINISRFPLTIVEKVREALNFFDGQGITKIIIDLRGNPGGEINAALGLCSMFVPKGVVARQVYKNHPDVLMYSDLEETKYELAVLINEGSASASELFAGAVDDTDAGVIIGKTSYGKGTMQRVRGLITGGAVRMTVGEYKTAGGRSVHGVGIKPDIEVDNVKFIPDTSYFKEIDFYNEYKNGSEGDGVTAIEQRLNFLGYFENEPDAIYDSETVNAVTTYQAYRGLKVTGVCDIYTLIDLNNIDYQQEQVMDLQLETAVDYLLGKDAQ